MNVYTVILWITPKDAEPRKAVFNGVEAFDRNEAQAAVIAKLERQGIQHGDICRIRRTDIEITKREAWEL